MVVLQQRYSRMWLPGLLDLQCHLLMSYMCMQMATVDDAATKRNVVVFMEHPSHSRSGHMLVQVRIEQVLISGPPLLLCFKLGQLLAFYRDTVEVRTLVLCSSVQLCRIV